MRNLRELGATVHAFRYRGSGPGAPPLPEGVTSQADLDQALSQPLDAVVVANRTDLHLDVALRAVRQGCSIYIEKPLSNSMQGVAELASLARSRDVIVEAGFMLRFHPNVQWMKQYVARGELGRIHYARALVGQYLPDWRPGVDHRQNYGAKRAWGGGVVFDLIHELDLIAHLLGEITDVTAFTAHVAELQIETEALAQIGLRMRSGALAQVHLDYVRRDYARNLEIVGSSGTLTWDYVHGVVNRIDAGGVAQEVHRVPAEFTRNTMFLAHMAHFLRRLTERGPAAASLEEGIDALRVALAVHASAESRRFVEVREIDLQS